MTKGLPLHWRLIPQRYNLLGSECSTCGTNFFPRRKLCKNCRRKGKLKDVVYSGRGEIYSYTIIHAPPRGLEYRKPYALAIIKLEEGPLLTAQVVDCEPSEVSVGSKVKAVFRRIEVKSEESIIEYGYKFKLER
jgi:uncharacterized OB-fold protein